MLFALAIAFANLGAWQSKRAGEKAEIEHQFETAGSLPLDQALVRQERFAHIDVSGYYDTTRHILWDNQIWHGRAGVYVFTPFHTLDDTTVLVNRGWLPLPADRQSLPDIPTPQYKTVLRGLLNTLPRPGRILGEADILQRDQWPQLVTYLNHADIEAALGTPIPALIVQLEKSENAGFEGRDWQPVFLDSNRHRAYAFQWFALATISMVLWVFGGFRNTDDRI